VRARCNFQNNAIKGNIMTSKWVGAFVFAVGLSVSAIPQAYAFQKGEGCDLKQTQDGFVALRKGPSTKSRLIHKLNPQFHRIFPDKRNNSWVHVVIGGYGDPEEEGVPVSERDVGDGYIKSSLIIWSSCGMAN
jgi:hypothetical protein